MTRIPPIVIMLVVGAVGLLVLKQVRFSSDVYRLFPSDLPEVRGMQQINRHFGRDAQLIVTIKGDTAWAVEEGAASLAEDLRKQTDHVSELFRELSMERVVVEGGELLAWSWLNAPPERLREVQGRLAPARSKEVLRESFAAIQDSFFGEQTLVKSYDPFGLTEWAARSGELRSADPMRSPDGTFEVFYLEGKGGDFSDYRDAKRWLEEVRIEVEKWNEEWNASHRAEGAVIVAFTGTPALMAEIGTEMERDMTVSVVLTMVLIAILFYAMHRQLRPLAWLMAAMVFILTLTLFLSGIFFGEMSVMSVGFGAILMGLAVDYGIIVFREATDTKSPAAAIRKAVGPGVLWAALTTGAVFLSLNLSSLPGLAQMGNLVAVGVLIGAGVMLWGFAPIASRFAKNANSSSRKPKWAPLLSSPWAVLLAGGVPLAAGVSLFAGKSLELEANFHPFRMNASPAITAWKDMQRVLRGDNHATPAVVRGDSLVDLHENLQAFRARVTAAQRVGLVEDAIFPSEWVPHPVHQSENVRIVRDIVADQTRLLAEISESGFSEDGARLTRSVLGAWERFGSEMENAEFVVPSGPYAKWSIDRMFHHGHGEYAAIAAIWPGNTQDRKWVTAICDEDANIASLSSLGQALNVRIQGDLLRVFLPMAGIMLLALTAVFRCWRDVVLSVFCLLVAAGIMLLLTQWTPLSWNSFNVCGIPLLFGTGLDFSIHMIFALRRDGRGGYSARLGMAKALLFCGLSSAIGFGSLATASAHGLSSLGLVCAAGLLINTAVAIWLLPTWYHFIHAGRDSSSDTARSPSIL